MERTENINIPLLRKIVEWAEAQDALMEEREWDQGVWFAQEQSDPMWCGTTMCIAGKALLETGWSPLFDSDGTPAGIEHHDGRRQHSYSAQASRELGLSTAWDIHGRWLYDHANDVETIRSIAESLAGEPL